MTFNPFHKDNCPLCLNALTQFEYNFNNLFSCDEGRHYFYSESKHWTSFYADVHIPNFRLIYYPARLTDPDQTFILSGENCLKPVCNFKGFFPINWNNPELSANRLRTMIVFS